MYIREGWSQYPLSSQYEFN